MVKESGTAITARRNELGITQAEAAAKAGISLATWRRFEQSPGLGYRADTIRGVERALKLARKELTNLLGEEQPAIAVQTEKEKAWIAPWNELWGATNWPSISPLMACAIQVALDSGRDMLESALDDSNFDPEEWPVLAEFDSRIFIEVGENKSWYRALAKRMRHLVDAMDKGQLIDESCECFADAALFGAAVRDAIATWDDDTEAWAGVSNALPIENDGAESRTADDEDEDWDDDDDDRWDPFVDDLDDRMPYREWDCVFPEYRKTRHLLNHRPVKTWFDEPDHELEAFRDGFQYNILALELMGPPPSRPEVRVWVPEKSDEKDS
ncbi:MAG TPA: helix-turn-helix transcriptional regulator [Trebonia sp.]|nr:helix-turn-helix transcriptional regulator [Trebonia sp.]